MESKRAFTDEEITAMHNLLERSGLGRIIRHNTMAMLNELLRLRKKLRDDAQ